ncbi:unnamed protein product [Urochloa decumbens]|uniref:Uncharacterized protein n=1 Tax=Urochloa decumbens TaxID=240449 RepID=A0ABC8VY07_9POAL
MGQALRRASGRVRPPPAPSPPARPPPPPPPRAPPAAAVGAPQDRVDVATNGDATVPTKNANGVLEERDPSYDEMLKHMVGRITTKPGGKPEMGNASVVQRYDRPLPKVRTSKAEPGESGSRQLPSGALNVQHIQEIIQLYQGKSSNHHGPMSVDDIASKFRVEASTVRNIVQSVSLPQDETVKKKEDY